MNMKTLYKFLVLSVMLIFIPKPVHSGIRGAGNYSGVVVFDRWGSCTLYSGIYVMYVSEKVKTKLLPFKNKAIQINATEVFQPDNPGDGLIKSFDYIGAAPAAPSWNNPAGLRIKTFPDFENGNKPSIIIEVSNNGREPLTIRAGELAPTLITKQSPFVRSYGHSDGLSVAVVTRVAFWIMGRGARWKGSSPVTQGRQAYSWSIGSNNALPEHLTLKPDEKRQIKIFFDLPEGQYDFLCGYGGGVHETECIASNLTAFDVTDGGKGKRIARHAS